MSQRMRARDLSIYAKIFILRHGSQSFFELKNVDIQAQKQLNSLTTNTSSCCALRARS
jgi:hypothetical protein